MPALRILLISIFIFTASALTAQERDSVVLKQDTLIKTAKPAPAKSPPAFKSKERLELEKMPRRAAIRSAIIPGWGQLTNRRWWKLPLVYGGLVGIALVYDFNQTNYKTFLTEAQNREYNTQHPKDPQKPTIVEYQRYPTSGIITIKDGYRRNRDLTILAGAAFYTVTIIDAYVDAKFFRFDITDELALKVKPAFQQPPPSNAFASPVPSVKVSMSLSK
ncbi:MAG TPA: DUF5683 domain-containing protein [Daejeonella sp.]|nr:DUF5683 domain-containing protein [Daejeonella sp.]